jgi:putative endonuclease
MRMQASDDLGAEGRQAAEAYLAAHGFRLLDRRWQHPDGRLDIVAVDNGTLVVCELRSRTHPGQGAALNELSAARRRLLRTLATDWLHAHGMRVDQIRIDIVGIVYEGTGGFTIEHVRGVG